ncbi:GntR family transcriptional regulator [Naasia lichenicola]|uniref:GntR family transcriptional regulator n=1 Tax=Naasia lichenicola TaxID=2565933 RepID=A0A4S4FEZ6_9MICO|nr:GntR family transcriptional regulator [Naasia lichenicola]THG28673.1 GntR family transcriptional regulator [Naasia lichenicola]
MSTERHLLRDEVYLALRRDIVAGRLPAGAVLKDAEIAAAFHTSKEPIRSALARLRDEGLVHTKPQSATRVAPLDQVAARESLEVVRTLSIRAVELGWPHLTAEHIAAMEDRNERFERAAAAGDVDATIEADDAFHDVFLALTGNEALRTIAHQHQDVLRRVEVQQFGIGSGAESAARHRALVEACVAGDLATARDLTAQIWSALETLLTPPAPPPL